ncbi:AAA family ATPase [Streptomyces sp. NPDC008001]|uniref:AAA family ATPase n=1 Tax=Streptomyces sp. NPDC008001 TaxID=3364804 RepID=UPI0036F10409
MDTRCARPDASSGIPSVVPSAAPSAAPSVVPSTASPAPSCVQRSVVTELRLSAFKSHRNASYALGPLTLFRGPSGSGKSSALQAYGVLARLAGGDVLEEALSLVDGGPGACVPQQARPDAQGRRGFRIGCTVEGPVGPVRLDVAVQAEPELRIVGERMTASGRTLLSTALRDPGRRAVEAAWHTAGAAPVTRAPLPDDRLGTALMPLRVAGKTAGQQLVLDAAEQVVVALRAVFACDPRPDLMRAPAARDDGLLRGTCDNVAAVLGRTRHECATRHAALVAAVDAGCRVPVDGLSVRGTDDGLVQAVLGQRAGGAVGLERLGDGELRYLALCLVLMTGPGVLDMDPAGEVLQARQALTVLADDFDRCLDAGQERELLALAVRMGERGHVRLVGAVRDTGAADPPVAGVSVVDLRGE